MDKKLIKEARCFNSQYIATDDIVSIELNYISSVALLKLINNATCVVVRVVSFEDDYIVVDMSKQFKSNQFEVPYTLIQSITKCEQEAVL